MDIMELGAIGELVGGVAVVASPVFVGLQVRQSNHLAKGASELEVGRMSMDYYRLLSEQDVAALWTKGYFSPEALADEEKPRFVCVNSMWIHMVQSMFRQHQRGLLPESSWKPLLVTLANTLEDSPLVRDVWTSNGLYLAQDFRDYVDRVRPEIVKGEFWKIPDSLNTKGA